jgi:hypothetical protein
VWPGAVGGDRGYSPIDIRDRLTRHEIELDIPNGDYESGPTEYAHEA